ncbi:MAG: LysR family transcriptional regulator [Mogibacterium sp.]|nr:LysR family transcriptional regulator [Mogibacterium sp.]
MNDLQIDYFMAVATNLSFTRTSEELFVSQPAISKQISQLEKELGTRLFVRNNQKTELTEAGKLYFELFRRYKADLINTKMEVAQLMGKTKRTIRVGFLEGWDLFNIIPPMMARFNEAYPDSEVVINCCGVKELATSLLTDSLDIVVTMKNSVEHTHEFSCKDIAEINKILIYSAGHRLASRSNLTLKDFSRDTFIAPWEIVDKMIVDAIASYTRPYGFVPELRFVKNHESTITCVRNNMGVAIMDEWVWAKNADDLRWIPIRATDTVSIARMGVKNTEQILFMEDLLSDIIEKQEQTKTEPLDNTSL